MALTYRWFLYIDPLKQGLKLSIYRTKNKESGVFIHRSIKTRIETEYKYFYVSSLFSVFIHRSIKTRIETVINMLFSYVRFQFLYIDPLKQGLKHLILCLGISSNIVFIHRSIKTRIETKKGMNDMKMKLCFYT